MLANSIHRSRLGWLAALVLCAAVASASACRADNAVTGQYATAVKGFQSSSYTVTYKLVPPSDGSSPAQPATLVSYSDGSNFRWDLVMDGKEHSLVAKSGARTSCVTVVTSSPIPTPRPNDCVNEDGPTFPVPTEYAAQVTPDVTPTKLLHSRTIAGVPAICFAIRTTKGAAHSWEQCHASDGAILYMDGYFASGLLWYVDVDVASGKVVRSSVGFDGYIIEATGFVPSVQPGVFDIAGQ